jgi:hypothetical protein
MICERDAAFEGHIGCSLAQTRGRESRIQRSAKDGFRSRFVYLCDRKGSSRPAFLQADAVCHASVMPSV